MRRWFLHLPIHRKLVAVALLVTTVALALATVGLLAFDLWRYQSTARDEAVSTAHVIAENSAAAILFDDVDAAQNNLESVRGRPAMRRACLYLSDRSLFAGFGRSDEFACPPSVPASRAPWTVVTGSAAVRSNDRSIGTVYIERELSDVTTRVAVAGLIGLAMLLLAATVAFALASRLNRSISTPITRLAEAARAIKPDGRAESMPSLEAGDDEIGDLVRAFTEMLRRVEDANVRLVESNERLQQQEVEREQLFAREREASRLKDEFLAAVSHELRTPLNTISGWIQILMTTKPSEQTMAKALTAIARNASAQTRVIEDLVDVSRIVTGKLHLRIEPIDLREVIEGAVEVSRPAANAKGIMLRVEAPPESCFVNGDRDRLQQIVWNLLSNAIKFTPNFGETIVTLTDQADAYALEVSDTGVGIPPSFLPHVFDRFRQADGSMTREYGGLGVGLAIVKELTELHGGTVTASSPGPGKGATFLIRFPQLTGLQAPLRLAAAPAQGPVAPLKGIRVLAVDDNADALEVLAMSLRNAGANVELATSGDEALRTWDDSPADILVCDLAMPAMDGFRVMSAIRERDMSRGHRTRAIAVTAYVTEEDRARTQAAGFVSHIAKPFDAGELVQTILHALDRA